MAFLKVAIAYYASLGIKVKRVTSNGSCYKSIAFCKACKRLRLNTSVPSPIV